MHVVVCSCLGADATPAHEVRKQSPSIQSASCCRWWREVCHLGGDPRQSLWEAVSSQPEPRGAVVWRPKIVPVPRHQSGDPGLCIGPRPIRRQFLHQRLVVRRHGCHVGSWPRRSGSSKQTRDEPHRLMWFHQGKDLLCDKGSRVFRLSFPLDVLLNIADIPWTLMTHRRSVASWRPHTHHCRTSDSKSGLVLLLPITEVEVGIVEVWDSYIH